MAEPVKFELSPRQIDAWGALDDPSVTEVLYGGAKGGGKSVLGCLWCYATARNMCTTYGIGPRDNPIPVGWMGRLKAKHFKDTTLETWKRFIPKEGVVIREQAQEIVIGGRVKIHYGGLDSEESVNKFNSSEYGFIFLDQAEEVAKDKVAVLLASRRLIINGKTVPPKALFTANPAQCWLKDDFILRPSLGKKFVQALPSDNPWLGAGYIRTLNDAFGHRPELLAAYRDGNWDSLEGFNVVIKGEWLAAARLREFTDLQTRPFLVCDPARFGDDETVIYLMAGSDIKDAFIYGQRDTMYTANFLHTTALKRKCGAVGVDEIGLGGGIADRLRELAGGQYDVYAINSAERSTQPERYYNLRAQMWDQAAQLLASGQVSLTWQDNELDRQLCMPTFDFRGGRVLVEAKSDLKERLGRSPDRADAYVMGLSLLERVGKITKDKGKGKKSKYHKLGAMAA